MFLKEMHRMLKLESRTGGLAAGDEKKEMMGNGPNCAHFSVAWNCFVLVAWHQPQRVTHMLAQLG